MKIEFTTEQYATLMKMAFLGNYMANGVRYEDEIITEMEKLEEYIYEAAESFKVEGLVEKDEDSFYPTQEMETEMLDVIDFYNEDIFWEELADRMAKRDFLAQFGEKAVTAMDPAERLEKLEPFLEKYQEEFEENGLKNLALK